MVKNASVPAARKRRTVSIAASVAPFQYTMGGSAAIAQACMRKALRSATWPRLARSFASTAARAAARSRGTAFSQPA